jgi:hypothetical protein
MLQIRNSDAVRSLWRGRLFQNVAAAFCVLFGIALILNQLEGEAEWSLYAELLHRGVRLYADLHLPLQPWFILETGAWMRVAGDKCIPYAGLALIHMLVLCTGLWLLLRQSAWPDWQKAIILVGSFFAIINFTGYRFDDFHVVADVLSILSMVLLLWLAKAQSPKRQVVLALVLGIFSAIAFTNRVTDGGALFVAVLLCVPLVARNRRLLLAALFLAAAALTVVLLVKCTGDTFHDYVSNSIFKASSAKGGTGTVLKGPLLGVIANLKILRVGSKRFLIFFSLLLALGYFAQRYWKLTVLRIVLLQLTIAVAVSLLLPSVIGGNFLGGASLSQVSMVVQQLTYPLGLLVAFRGLRWKLNPEKYPWDPREALILVPIGTLLSAAASQATGTSNSTTTMGMLFLLVPVLWQVRPRANWAAAFFVTVLAVLGITGIARKIADPYSWGVYQTGPMFENRQWYKHPLYGEMYIGRDELHFIEPVCAQMGPVTPSTELLSLPYSYANYFCGTLPWHGYVQTWFDTFTPESVAILMQQLETAPPQWILYQRQLERLHAHEVEYNHGQPIAHRQLDELIMQKLSSGQWRLVDKQDYLQGDGWYLIQTRP